MAITGFFFAFLLLEYHFNPNPDPTIRSTAATRSRQQARWSALTVLALIFGSGFADATGKAVLDAVLVCDVLISQPALPVDTVVVPSPVSGRPC